METLSISKTLKFWCLVVLLMVIAPPNCLMAQSNDCLADAGTVIPPELPFICFGGYSMSIGIMGDNQNGHQTVWLISTEATDSIMGLSYSNSINAGGLDFPAAEALPAGVYRVRPLNFDIVQTAQILDILSSSSVTYLTDFENQLTQNAICSDLGNALQMTVAAPTHIEYTVICDDVNEGEHYVNCVVTGGYPALSSDFFYTYQGTSGGNSIDNGTNFTLGPYTDSQGFTLTASDGMCSSATVEQINVACTKCDYDAGTMSSTLRVFYSDQPISVPGSIGASSGSDVGAVMYILHTNADTIPGNILAMDTTISDGSGDFGINVPGLLYETTYYVSLWIGNDKEPIDGLPDNDGCYKVCRGTPIYVLAEVPIVPPTGTNKEENAPRLTFNTETGEAILDFWAIQDGTVSAVIYALSGQQVGQYTFWATKGANHISGFMDRRQLPANSLYILSLQDSKRVQTIKFK